MKTRYKIKMFVGYSGVRENGKEEGIYGTERNVLEVLN